MSWIDAINEIGERNAGAFEFVSGVGAGGAIVSFFTTLDFQRDVERSLDEIKNQLEDIRANTELIIAQNKQILDKIDQLPTRWEVQIMIQQAVLDDSLNNAYSSLRSAENDELSYWDIDSPAWVAYRQSLQFAFDHDNRISQTAQLLAHCSFAFVITKGRAITFIIHVIEQRLARVKLLAAKLKAETKTVLLKLREDLLANTEYVASHNMDDDLTDIGNIKYEMEPNRILTRPGRCLQWGPNGRCMEPGAPRFVLDHSYKISKARHQAAIEQTLDLADSLNSEYGEVADVITQLTLILTILGRLSN